MFSVEYLSRRATLQSAALLTQGSRSHQDTVRLVLIAGPLGFVHVLTSNPDLSKDLIDNSQTSSTTQSSSLRCVQKQEGEKLESALQTPLVNCIA